MTLVLDVDETDGCPRSEHCARCGGVSDLVVATFSTWVGVFCATVCPDCVDYGPKMSGIAGTMEWVAEHCEHLGCDLDEMADALNSE